MTNVCFEEEFEQFIEIKNSEQMLNLWLDILKLIDMSLELEVLTHALSKYEVKYKGYPLEYVDSMHFWGYDSQNRRLEIPGYGIWKNCEDMEFYHG